MSTEKGVPLPKFGEWDVNNPASAEGFTFIFNKASKENKTTGNNEAATAQFKNNGAYKPDQDYDNSRKSRKWLCCG